MKKLIKITQIKSGIGYHRSQKGTLKALGISKMHQSVEKEASPSVLGMVNKIRHLLKVEEVSK
ncbi:50S ribosomal protein L30 [bacterium]|nr:50S ribosomal protein L30 [bacterium]